MSASSNVELQLSLEDSGRSRLALSIPLAECITFAVNPLKWLRFLGFAIYGREGHLSTEEAGAEIDDYTADIEPRTYYFVSEGKGEPRLVDVNAMDHRTSVASSLSWRSADFRQRVIDRDGTCVITSDLANNCTACHIIPHSKGDDYMLHLSHHRGETYGLVDTLNDIDATLNGILLRVDLHRPFGVGELAFLKTPNFALTVDDIPYNTPNEDSPTSRLTLHHFRPAELGPIIPTLAPHNSDARQPQNISEWPPAIILDLCYASAALKAWGPKPFITYARKRAKDSYYGNAGEPEDLNAQLPNQPTPRAIRNARWTAQKSQSSHISERQAFCNAMDVVMSLWMRSARKGQRDTEATDRARNQDNIKTWLQSVEESI